MLVPVPFSETGETYYEPPGLRELVEQCEHFPGWEFRLIYTRSEDGSGGLMLQIISDVQDSMDFSKRRVVWHMFLVPATPYNRNTWAIWILERICDVMRHEACEAFRINGVREFAPHHGVGEDQYITWHTSDYATALKSSGEY